MNNTRWMSDTFIGFLLVLVTLVTRWAFLHVGTMGDPDSVVMAAGMAQGVLLDSNFGDAMLYGRQLSPGFYYFTKWIYPLLFDSPAHIMGFLNVVGLVSGTLLCGVHYKLLRSCFPVPLAAGSALLTTFSAIVWESGTYFHPGIVSILLLGISMLAWRRIESSLVGAVYYVLTAGLASLAMLTRIDVAFALPALVIATLTSKARNRDLAILSSIVLLVAITYLWLQSIVASTTSLENGDLFGFATRYITTFKEMFTMFIVPKSVVWVTLGCGIVTTVAAVAGVLLKSRSGSSVDRRIVLVSVVWIVPPLAVWLGHEAPILRHYLLVAFVLPFIVGATVLRNFSRQRLALFVASAICVNLALPEILYRSYNARHTENPKTPHGTLFYNHQLTVLRGQRYNEMSSDVRKAAVTTSGGRQPQCCPAWVQVDWESYGYLLYELSATGQLTKEEEISPVQGLFVSRYALGEASVSLAQVNNLRDSRVVEELNADIESRLREGFYVFISRELARLQPNSGPKHRLHVY